MADNEIEMWATLAIWFIGGWFVGSTLGWYLFLRLFKIVDDYLHSQLLTEQESQGILLGKR